MRILILSGCLGAAALVAACASGGDEDIQPLNMGQGVAPAAGAAGASAAGAAATGAPSGRLSVDMSVARLVADPRGHAVLEKDLPGMLSNPDYPFFKNMSLRHIQAISGGRMSPEKLDKVEADLAAASGGPPGA